MQNRRTDITPAVHYAMIASLLHCKRVPISRCHMMLNVTQRTRWRAGLLGFGSALLGGTQLVACTGTVHVTNVRAEANPLNVLSAQVTFTAAGVDSARVVYSTPGDTVAATPYVPVTGSAGRVTILGLLPFHTYVITVQALGGGHRTSATWGYATGGLPPWVQAASLVPTGTFTRGYTLVAPLRDSSPSYAAVPPDSALAVAFNALGRVRWYRVFPVVGSVELKQQANGHFTIALPTSGWGPRRALVRATADSGRAVPQRRAVPGGFNGATVAYAEFLPSGEIIHKYDAGPGEFTGSHELIITGPDSSPVLHLFGYTRRPFDFSRLGGPPNGSGVGHQIIRESPPGVIEFKWDAWDHYGATDWIEPTGAAPPDDFDHPNSLDFDLDSNYVVSFRNMGAVVKVNAQSGAIMWQLGGARNQFTFRGDPLGFFSGQHSVRVLPNGHILLYDNGLRHKPPVSRAVEYALDVPNKVATMVWEYRPKPGIFTVAFGSAQRLSNGNTLVGLGYAGEIHEVDAQGKLVARGTFDYGLRPAFYRATRIASLYEYERP